MAKEVVALEFALDAGKAQMTLGELEEGFESMKEQLKKVGRGSEEFKTLSTAMANTSKEIKNIELGFEGLDREQVASELGSVAGAVGDVTASLVLMGGESETMEQIGASIEKAMAISMGFKGAIEGLSSANKLYNNLLKQGKIAVIAKSVAEKAAAAGTWILNTANKALNTTLKMNPIGLIVIAITAVVGAIVYFKDSILGLIDIALKPFQWAIDKVVDALQWLGIMESDSAIATREAEEAKASAVKKASEEKIKEYEKQIEALKKLQEAHEDSSNSLIDMMLHEMDIAKAKGEAGRREEFILLKTKINIAKKSEELALKILNADISRIKEKRRIGEDVYIKELDELARLKKEADKAVQSKIEADQSYEIFKEKHNQSIRDKEKKAAEEASKRRAKRREEEKKQLIEDAKSLAEFEEEQARIKIQLIQDEGKRARAEIDYNSQLELEALEKKGLLTFDAEMLIAQKKHKALADLKKTEDDKRFALEKEAQDKRDEYDKLLFDAKLANEVEETERQRLQLEEDYQNNIAALEEQGLLTTELEIELLMAREKALSEIKKKEREKDFALATASIGALSALNKAATDTALLNAAGDEEKKEKIRKASFEREKKLNVAMAAINGAQAVLAGFAQGGLPMAILAGVTAAAQLAAIVATTYEGGAGAGVETPTQEPRPDGAGAAGGGAAISPVTNTSTILGNQQVFVTETDITETQNNVSVIEESATF